MHQLLTHRARLHHSRPPHHEWDPMSAFPGIGLVATQRPAGKVTAGFQLSHAHIRCKPVVAGKHEQRVLSLSVDVECFEHIAHNCVGLHHQVCTGILKPACPLPGLVDGQRGVWRSQGKVEQERHIIPVASPEKVHRPVAERGQHVFQLPARHRRPLDTCPVVLEVGCRQQLAGQAHRAVLIDKTIGRPVGNVSSEVDVEAASGGPARDGPRKDGVPGVLPGLADLFDNRSLFGLCKTGNHRPLLLRHWPLPAQMPLADTRGPEPLLLSEGADREAVGRNQRWPPGADDPRLQPRPPVIATGQQGVAGGRTHTRRRVRIGKPHPLGRERVDVWRRNQPSLGVVTLHVPITEVIGIDDHDVGRGCLNDGRDQQQTDRTLHHMPQLLKHQPRPPRMSWLPLLRLMTHDP